MRCRICDQKPMNCDCTASEQEWRATLDELSDIEGVVEDGSLGDSLIRLGDLLESVRLDENGIHADSWKTWLRDVGERINDLDV